MVGNSDPLERFVGVGLRQQQPEFLAAELPKPSPGRKIP